MFYPDGFVQLYEVLRESGHLAHDRFPTKFERGSFDIIPDARLELYQMLIFHRFLDAHYHEMWIFQYPNILLRASPELFYKSHSYSAPCPEEQDEAKEALRHIKEGRMVFLDERMRIDARGNVDSFSYEDFKDLSDELRPVHGAIICWKPKNWPVDLEKELHRYRDKEFFKGHPFYSSKAQIEDEASTLKAVHEAFQAVCPLGKAASDLTWSEIEKLTGWSRRQINRALNAHDGQATGQPRGQSLGN